VWASLRSTLFFPAAVHPVIDRAGGSFSGLHALQEAFGSSCYNHQSTLLFPSSTLSAGGLLPALHVPQEAFGTTDEDKICLEILSKGELQVGRTHTLTTAEAPQVMVFLMSRLQSTFARQEQAWQAASSLCSMRHIVVTASWLCCLDCLCCLQVSDKERQAQQDNLYKDVAGVLVEKTVSSRGLARSRALSPARQPSCSFLSADVVCTAVSCPCVHIRTGGLITQ
jgi:hypothetical protein